MEAIARVKSMHTCSHIRVHIGAIIGELQEKATGITCEQGRQTCNQKEKLAKVIVSFCA